MSKRIPYDSKSHKIARRAAARAKESGRMAWTAPDRDDVKPAPRKRGA